MPPVEFGSVTAPSLTSRARNEPAISPVAEVVAIGSDLDGMNTQNWAMPQPPTLVAVNLDADDAAKNYRVDHLVQAPAAAGAEALAPAQARQFVPQ